MNEPIGVADISDAVYEQAIEQLHRKSGCWLVCSPFLALTCLVAGVLAGMNLVQCLVLLLTVAISWLSGFWLMVYGFAIVRMQDERRLTRKQVQP